MKLKDIEVGKEYAIYIGARSHYNRPVRGRVVAMSDVTASFGLPYNVHWLRPQDDDTPRRTNNRNVLMPWADYAAESAAFDLKQVQAAAQPAARDRRANKAFRVISSAAGLTLPRHIASTVWFDVEELEAIAAALQRAGAATGEHGHD